MDKLNILFNILYLILIVIAPIVITLLFRKQNKTIVANSYDNNILSVETDIYYNTNLIKELENRLNLKEETFTTPKDEKSHTLTDLAIAEPIQNEDKGFFSGLKIRFMPTVAVSTVEDETKWTNKFSKKSKANEVEQVQLKLQLDMTKIKLESNYYHLLKIMKDYCKLYNSKRINQSRFKEYYTVKLYNLLNNDPTKELIANGDYNEIKLAYTSIHQ